VLPFSDTELAYMRGSASIIMMDTCRIHTYAESSADGYGVPVAGYTTGAALSCGYKARSTREVQQGNQTVLIDGELRLPQDTVINSLDRVEITHRYGEAITPTLLFSIIGQPALGPSAIVVNLMRVASE
jgi:hypothetical protein